MIQLDGASGVVATFELFSKAALLLAGSECDRYSETIESSHVQNVRGLSCVKE